MIIWDWDEVVVFSGGWWLALIGLAISLVSAAVGYCIGRYRSIAADNSSWDDDGPGL